MPRRTPLLSALLVFTGMLIPGQESSASRPGAQADRLDLMALPAVPDGVRLATTPVVTIDRVALDTRDLFREIAGGRQWDASVETLIKRTVLDLELVSRKIVIPKDDLQTEAIKLLAARDSAAVWSDVAISNPHLANDLLAQARDELGWTQLFNLAARPERDSDANKRILVQLYVRRALESYTVRKKERGAALPAGVVAEVSAPDGKLHVLTESTVVEHLRGTLPYYDLVVAREGLIDDYLLSRELEALGRRVSPEDVAKFVTDRWATLTSDDPRDDAKVRRLNLTSTDTFRRVSAMKRITGFSPRPEDVERFAQEREAWLRTERRAFRQILFRTVDPLTGSVFNDATTEQPGVRVKETYAALMKGGDFGLAAREQSEDPGSAMFDGMAGPIGQFDQGVDPAIRDAVFALTSENPISAPVKGIVGWYIFKLEHVLKGTKDPTLNDPKHREMVEDYYARHALSEYVAALRKKSTIKLGAASVMTAGW
jgi:PPIC-type PPIASE domain